MNRKGSGKLGPARFSAYLTRYCSTRSSAKHSSRLQGNYNGLRGTSDIAYQLETVSTTVKWVKRGFLVWQEWRQKSLEKLRAAEFVLIADIAAFYENIDLPRLSSDLRATGMGEEATRLLSACLNRWAEPRGKGIPQGRSASDILAKLYLELNRPQLAARRVRPPALCR